MNVARPSELCPVCRDCDGRGYSSPEPCGRCHGRGWLLFNTKCEAEHREHRRDCIVVRRCNLDPWHEGDHCETATVNDGTFFDPVYRTARTYWPNHVHAQFHSQGEKP